METTQETRPSWLDRPVLTSLNINWETLIFALILIVGLISRFYDLEPRVMSHDENSHVYYSWRLYKGDGYQHTPLTHGPFLFHITALSYFFFGDNDTTARIPYALFSVATIAFVWFYRRYLGRAGTIITAILVLISPFMLYYGRYVRNEAFVAFFGIVTIWAILRYLETGEVKYTYWLTAATMLHFTAKETSFIYTAQALLILGLIFVFQITQKKWKDDTNRKAFLVALIVAFILLAAAGAITVLTTDTAAPAPVEGEQITSPQLSIITILPIVLAGFGLLAALFFAIRGFGWEKLKENRPFGLIILLLTLVLPHLAALPVRLVGWDPLDYSTAGILRTSVFVVPLALISIGVGLLWNWRIWLINAAIFYIPFTLLYTTFFTNGNGFFSGLVGSLGYWLEQQGVERGSQPFYYYILLQVPFYEFLPALGVLLTLGIIVARKLNGRPIEKTDSEIESVLDTDEVDPELENKPRGQVLFLILTGFWIITSVIAYTIAGEKMPWLTVHIALPLILFSGWGFGQLVEEIDWKNVLSQRGLLLILMIIVFLFSLSTLLGSLMGPNRPFGGQQLDQLNSTLNFFFSLLITIGSGAAIAFLLKDWGDMGQLVRLSLLTFFSLLGLLTVRAAYRAAYINYDNPTEYLVYAHSASGVKEALAQIEELSVRTTDGLAMQVAYDDETTYPYWWYLRNYTNQKYYGASPTRELREAPAILVGDNNFAKLEPVVGQAYHQFDYIRIWWPNQDYYGLTWERIRGALTNPEMRAALWDIWFDRDYTKYAEETGKTDLTLPTWQPSDRMRLYVRKDIAAQVWNLGASPALPEEIIADPYEGRGVTLISDQTIGGEGILNLPRNLAIAQDGTLYVTDTGNHRILHMDSGGEILHSWGSFADSATIEGGAPGGAFYEPWSIAIGSDGSVFVADTWNHRIQKFTPDGNFITQWGTFGQGETGAAFWGPRDIAIDDQDRIYITDTGNKRVVVFDQNGNYLTEFGTAGLLSGQFDEPVGVAVGPEGLVYVADTWNQRVQVFELDPLSNNFIPLREWEIVGWYGQSLDNKPYIRVDQNGHVFVSDPEGYRILEFTSQGEFIRYWGDYGNGPSSFILPTGLAVDPTTGSLWVADAGNHRLMRFPILGGESP
jgi:predicted membrane-bound mannosyltransferase/DNA-binding beta-propeller fold protein YncE